MIWHPYLNVLHDTDIGPLLQFSVNGEQVMWYLVRRKFIILYKTKLKIQLVVFVYSEYFVRFPVMILHFTSSWKTQSYCYLLSYSYYISFYTFIVINLFYTRFKCVCVCVFIGVRIGSAPDCIYCVTINGACLRES